MSNFNLRNGRIIISARSKYSEKLKEALKSGIPLAKHRELIHITPTLEAKKAKLLLAYEELTGEKLVGTLEQKIANSKVEFAKSDEPSKTKKGKNKKVKNKKGKKNKKYKNKKKSKQMLSYIGEALSERDEKNSNLMAELIKHSDDIAIIDKTLWLYDRTTGCFDSCCEKDVSAKLRSLLKGEERLKVSTREYKEAYQQLLISNELKREEEFFANQPYVNCLNGVVDVRKGELLKHSPKYLFKHCIKANYVPGAKCKKFLEYIEFITSGDEELKALIQVAVGYILSHYNNAKTAFLLYGIPHTGKSVLCKVLENIVGADYVAHIDMKFLHRQEYAASLSGKIFNVAPDLDKTVLKEVGFFKSLTSHDDALGARLLYANVGDVKGETKMLFSTNHLLSFDTALDFNDIEAVFNRLLYVPFQNKPITEDADNKHMSDEISEERDGIFSWAMEGLRRYVEMGERFPKSKLSMELKEKNMVQYCPEKTFCDLCLKADANSNESVMAIKTAFEHFSKDSEVKVKCDINKYLTEHMKLTKKKKRIDDDGNPVSTGNPIAVYEGIRLRKKYR